MARRNIVNRLRALGEELGRRPTVIELVATGVTRAELKEHFPGGFSEALIVAGLMTTREQVVRNRKKRGYVPPWNYIGGETPMDSDTAMQWRMLSKALIKEIGVCEEVELPHTCTPVLAAHHIIPRRCGGEVLEERNVVVICNASHKLQRADLYWRTADDIDLRVLPEYQLRRLARGTYGLEQEDYGLDEQERA